MKNIIEIKEELEIPGTDIILEKGDKIKIMKEMSENRSMAIRYIRAVIEEEANRGIIDELELMIDRLMYM